MKLREHDLDTKLTIPLTNLITANPTTVGNSSLSHIVSRKPNNMYANEIIQILPHHNYNKIYRKEFL